MKLRPASTLLSTTLALGLLAAACGGAPRGDVVQRGAKTYPAFAFAEDAEDPTTGVILGTGEKTSTLIELRREGRATIELPAPDRDDDGDDSGRGAARVELAVTHARPRTEKEIAIVSGVFASGAARWQLGVAIASEAAASILGKRVGAYRWEVRGEGEGGEAMLAAAMAACLTGVAVKDDVAVLGRLLPDGSLGASEELAEEVAAMLAAGKKKIGVPSGVAAASSESGRPVQLAQLVRAKGGELVAVDDLAEAYALVTGAALPETSPASGEELRLPTAATAALEERYAQWRTEMAGDWAVILMFDNEARLPARVAQLAETAQREARHAEELRTGGAWAAALDRLAEARAQSRAAVAAFRAVELVRGGRLEEAVAQLERDSGRAEAVAALTRIASAAARTSGAQIDRLAQASAAMIAVALAEAAEASRAGVVAALRALPPAELGSASAAQRVAGAVVPYLSASARAKAAAELARAELELGEGGGGPARSTAEIERAVPGHIMRQQWLALVRADQDAELAASLRVAARLLELPDAWTPELVALRARWGEQSAPWHLLRWSAQLAGPSWVAELAAERESLAVRRDRADGSPSLMLGQGAALPVLLAIAERHARQAAHAAGVGLGAVPLSQALAFQVGRQLAARAEPASQLRALSAFWRSTEIGQASLRLARAAAPAP